MDASLPGAEYLQASQPGTEPFLDDIDAVTSDSLNTSNRFPELALELRQKIWEQILPGPRLV
jgi:hypothetical protein